MTKFLVVLLLAVTLAVAGGCCTNPGSREFIPGQGWVPTKSP